MLSAYFAFALGEFFNSPCLFLPPTQIRPSQPREAGRTPELSLLPSGGRTSSSSLFTPSKDRSPLVSATFSVRFHATTPAERQRTQQQGAPSPSTTPGSPRDPSRCPRPGPHLPARSPTASAAAAQGRPSPVASATRAARPRRAPIGAVNGRQRGGQVTVARCSVMAAPPAAARRGWECPRDRQQPRGALAAQPTGRPVEATGVVVRSALVFKTSCC